MEDLAGHVDACQVIAQQVFELTSDLGILIVQTMRPGIEAKAILFISDGIAADALSRFQDTKGAACLLRVVPGSKPGRPAAQDQNVGICLQWNFL